MLPLPHRCPSSFQKESVISEHMTLTANIVTGRDTGTPAGAGSAFRDCSESKKEVFLEIRVPAIPQLNKNKLLVIIFLKNMKDSDHPGEQAEAYTYYDFRILTSSLGK